MVETNVTIMQIGKKANLPNLLSAQKVVQTDLQV